MTAVHCPSLERTSLSPKCLLSLLAVFSEELALSSHVLVAVAGPYSEVAFYAAGKQFPVERLGCSAYGSLKISVSSTTL